MAKILKYGLLVVFLIFLILLLVPWLFKDEIFTRVQEEANKNLKGELVIEDLSLSLIRNFPSLSLSLSGLQYTGAAPFQGEELFKIAEVRATLDLMSVISGEQIKVKELAILQPNINALVLEDGTANYDIANSSENSETNGHSIEEPEGSGSFDLGVEEFRIEGMNARFVDIHNGINTSIENGNLKLTGNFSDEEVSVNATSAIDAFTVGFGGTNYLDNVLVDLVLDARYNQSSGKLTLGQNQLTINNLQVVLQGWIQSLEDDMKMDLSFNAPHTEFKEVLSLVPAVYLNDFDDVKTSGTFLLSGMVQGDYAGESENYPAFEMNLEVSEAQFQYPDLPSSVEKINFKTNITHAQGDLDKTVVNISKATASIANNPFEASLILARPISDPAIDATVKTVLNLNKLTEVVPIEGYDLQGTVFADAFVKASMSQFEKGDFDAIQAGGWVALKKFNAKTSVFNHDIEIDTAYATIKPSEFTLPILDTKIGQSDFSGSGKLVNVLPYALENDTLSGSLSLSSVYMDVNELMNSLVDEEQSERTEANQNEIGVDTASISAPEIPVVPGNIDLTIKMDADKVKYNDVDISNLSGKLKIANAEARLERFEMDILEGKLKMDGLYSTPENTPTVDANFELKSIDAKSAFTSLNTVQSFAPVAQATTGKISTKFSYNGKLNPDLSPDLSSIKAKGNLYTLGLIVQPEIMKMVSGILDNDSYEKIRFQDADLGFEINDGRINVSPAKLYVGDLKAEFSGSHGLDKTMDYNLKTEVPLDKIDIPEELKMLGIVSGTIPVEFKIGGTIDKPNVKPVFGKASSVQDIINTVIDNVVQDIKDSAIETVNIEAEKLVEEAKKQADEIMREAVKQAATLKAEADKQAEALKKEARKQAEALVKEAEGDVFKEAAAKIAADQLVKEADKQIDALQKEAEKQADNVIIEAQKQADAIIKEAEEKAKIKN